MHSGKKRRASVIFAATAAVSGIAVTQPAFATVKINEMFIDAPGTNSTQDFVELRSTTPGESVTGMTMLLLEGDSGAAGGTGVSASQLALVNVRWTVQILSV